MGDGRSRRTGGGEGEGRHGMGDGYGVGDGGFGDETQRGARKRREGPAGSVGAHTNSSGTSLRDPTLSRATECPAHLCGCENLPRE